MPYIPVVKGAPQTHTQPHYGIILITIILTGLVGAPGIGNIGGRPGIGGIEGLGLLSRVPALLIIIVMSFTSSSDLIPL